MKTIYRYVVVDDRTGEQRKNWDFIQHSGRCYYYDAKYEITEDFINGAFRWFDEMRHQILADDYTFPWDQLTKLPYLRLSLAQEQQMRYPVTVYGDRVCCGAGRTLMIHLFHPHIAMDRLLITDQPIQHDLRLSTMAELEYLLLRKSWFQENLTQRSRLYWHVHDGVIYGHDVSRRWTLPFPFCQRSARNEPLIRAITDICKSRPNDPIDSIVKSIALLDVDQPGK